MVLEITLGEFGGKPMFRAKPLHPGLQNIDTVKKSSAHPQNHGMETLLLFFLFLSMMK